MVRRASFRANARTATHTRRDPSLRSVRLARLNPMIGRSMRNPLRVVDRHEKSRERFRRRLGGVMVGTGYVVYKGSFSSLIGLWMEPLLRI